MDRRCDSDSGINQIQALAANRADDALADGIGLRTVRRRLQHGHTEHLYRFIEVLGEDAVAIVEQIFVTPFELGGLA
jgi:hypothetical protein